MIGFTRPLILLLLLLLPWWWWRRRRVPIPVATVSDVAPFQSAVRGRWRLWVPPTLRSLGWAALILAAAGPYRRGDRTRVTADGIAIVLALDISSSMLAEDFAPANRLTVAKQQATAFIRARANDRIGLVVFAGEALTLVPVTLDYPTLERAIAGIEIGQLEDGTAIGMGLATAVARLRKVPGETKVVVLLTDGENNRGQIDPSTAAQTAEAFGIRLYTVGIGSEGEARIPTGRGLSGYRYEVVTVSMDEPLLTEMAEQTGGKYFRARDAQGLTATLREIDRLERTPVEVIRYRRQDERTTPFLAVGLLLLAAELAIGATLVVRVP